jgi:hypothetical protein
MEVVKVESLDQMTNGNVYYELDGAFYQICWNCGKALEVDHHVTRHDLEHNRPNGTEEAFCGEECEKKWFMSEYPTLDAALLAGEEERAFRLFEFKIKSTSYVRHYDNDEYADDDCDSPEGFVTIWELKEDARSIAQMAAENDRYFKTMTMDEEPYISVDNEYIDFTFDFTEGDFTTDIRVSYVMESEK